MKVNNYQDRVYSERRLLYPMRRVGPKGSGQFSRITWDEAMTEIAERFREIVATDGPQAILPYSYLGTQGIINGLNVGDPLFNKLGATVCERTFCDSGSCAAYMMTIGHTPGVDPEAFVHSKYIVLWACNTLGTNSYHWPFIEQARKNGAKLVVIDPVRTRTARLADWHIPIRPGSDGALALAMMHIVIKEGLTDRSYIDAHTIGVVIERHAGAASSPLGRWFPDSTPAAGASAVRKAPSAPTGPAPRRRWSRSWPIWGNANLPCRRMRIDAIEIKAGRRLGKPREKLVSVTALIAAVRQPVAG